MIKSITLDNFQKHKYLSLAFNEGVNVISGGNYQGKTTILRAILFALFGTTAVPGGAKAVQRRGGEAARVTMTFSVAGGDYTLERTLKYASLAGPGLGGHVSVPSSVFCQEGEQLVASPLPIATGTTAVNDRILALLGKTKADFLSSSYLKQGDTSALVRYGAAGLTEMIERTCGADLLSKVLPLLKGYKDFAAGAVNSREYVMIEPIDEEIFGIITELEAMDTEQLELQVKMEVATGAHEQAEASLWSAVESNQKSVAAMAELGAAADTDTRARIELQKANAAAALVPPGEDVTELSGILQQLQTARRLDEDLEQAVKEASVASAKFAGHARSVFPPGAKETMEGLHEKITANLVVSESQLRTKRIEVASGVCSACDRPFEGFDKAEHEKAINIMVPVIASGRAQLQQVEAELDTLNYAAAMEAKAEASVIAANAAVSDARSEAQAAERPAGTIQGLRTRIKAAGLAAEDFGRVSANLTLAEANSKAAKGILNELEMIEIDLLIPENEIRGAVETLKNKVYALQQAQNAANLASATLSSSLATLTADRDRAESGNATLQESESDLDALKSLIAFLRTNREGFMDAAWVSILQQASAFCSQATGGSITEIVREGGEFFYREEGDLMSARHLASGTQGSIIGLGLQLALAETVANPLGCLLGDEVSADMDSLHAGTVTQLLGGRGYQIILVSHRDMDRATDCSSIEL